MLLVTVRADYRHTENATNVSSTGHSTILEEHRNNDENWPRATLWEGISDAASPVFPLSCLSVEVGEGLTDCFMRWIAWMVNSGK